MKSTVKYANALIADRTRSLISLLHMCRRHHQHQQRRFLCSAQEYFRCSTSTTTPESLVNCDSIFAWNKFNIFVSFDDSMIAITYLLPTRSFYRICILHNSHHLRWWYYCVEFSHTNTRTQCRNLYKLDERKRQTLFAPPSSFPPHLEQTHKHRTSEGKTKWKRHQANGDGAGESWKSKKKERRKSMKSNQHETISMTIELFEVKARWLAKRKKGLHASINQ